MRALLAAAAFVVVVAAGNAVAEITVRPQLSPARIVVGQAATLDVEIQGTQDASVPAIPVPEGLRLDYRGQSTQVSIVNGAMSATLTHSFVVVAERAGTFEVGPIRVQAAGHEVDGGSVRLEVTAPGARPVTAGTTATGDDALQLFLELDETRLYLHERARLRVRLEVTNVQVTDVRYPAVVAEGFSTGKFDEPHQRQETRDGRLVHVVEFATDVVPLRAGDTTLGANLALAAVVRRGNPLFDQFFGMDAAFGGRKNLTLQAEPLALTVLPLPVAGRPPSFAGAVGSFSLGLTASPLEVRAGDPVTLTLTLRGTGNLAHADAPALAGSDTLKVYPPTTPAEGERGTAIEKRFEQVVIPQVPGTVTLPALAFSFFDPGSETYQTASTAPIPLRVLPAPAVTTATVPPPVVAAAARPEALGRDLVSIKDDPGVLRTPGRRRSREPALWAVQLVPVLLWMAIVGWDRRRRRLSGDERYTRFTRAGKIARARLGEAQAALDAGDRPRFYDALARAVHEYLAAKLDLAPGAVSAETVAARLRGASVVPALIEEAEALLALCERVRFAPHDDGDTAGALARAETLVRGLERRRRLGRGGTALATLVLVLGSLAYAAGDNAKTLFFRGNALYGDGRFAEAAQTYEAVRAGGLESAALYFNLGTAYARAGDRGRALLNYERARRLEPADPDLAANLAFVRGEAPDDGAFSLRTKVLLPLADRFDSDTLVVLAASAWWLLMTAMIVGRLLPGLARASRWLVAAAFLAMALAGSAAAYRIARIDTPAWAGVLRDVPVRFEPSETGTTHFEAGPGTVVEVVAERAGWAQVARRADGRRGWVPLDALERF